MSILLETLNHQQREDKELPTSLPNIYSSHYDDEMLGDEWLYKRVNQWRLVCLCLLLALIASWSYFWLASSGSKTETHSPISVTNTFNDENSLKQTVPVELKKSLNENAANNQPLKDTEISSNENISIRNNVDSVNSIKVDSNNNKQAYTPQKRVVVEKPVQQVQQTAQQLTGQKLNGQKLISPSTQAVPAQKTVNQSNNTNYDSAILKEDLPAELLQEFPPLEVNSYVVADDPEKSFVILDGAFYKINQLIAIDLILRQITADYIVVEFQNRLVKIKLK